MLPESNEGGFADMDKRIYLPEGYQLTHAGKVYTIRKYISAGGNSVVYEAGYQDTLMPEKNHTVLIKELYPYDSLGRITRKDTMELQISPEAERLFENHKESFLVGNRVHLTLAQEGKGGIAENLDSFAANGTIYTILTARKGWVLQDILERKREFPGLEDIISIAGNLLEILTMFHEHRLLHLDISSDNIFMLEPRESGKFPTELLLLDFNSVYFMDDPSVYLEDFYLGKPGYMAPEAVLHNREELGPWTDLYSVAAVFYCLLNEGNIPQDIELSADRELISSYSRLLLHEKEVTAEQVNRILSRGLKTLPGDRYQNTREMLEDLQELKDILSGRIKIPVSRVSTEEPFPKKPVKKWMVRVGMVAGIVLLTAGAYLGGRFAPQMKLENTELDLTKFPLEVDESVVITQQDVRAPLEDNRMTMQVQTSSAVRIMLKNYEHERDLSEVFSTYSLFCIYCGKEDKRGWQFGDTTYDFFYTEDNTLHMELPFQDENTFDLDYVGVIFQNFNYNESQVVLDIKQCTLVDGKGNSYEMTELLGSHLLYFDEERWQQNMITTENQKYVKNFQDILGGKLIVDAEINYLDPLLEVTWISDNPEIVSVDDWGRIQGLRQGIATLTVTIRDKKTGQERSTQMLVNVVSKL